MKTTTRLLLVTGCLALISLALFPAAAAAQARQGFVHDRNAFRFGVGLFTPEGGSRYWDDKGMAFSGDAGDMQDVSAELMYVRYLGPRLGLLVSGHIYEGDMSQSYLDYVDESDAPIRHQTAVSVGSINLGLLFHILPRDSVVVPYLAGGGGLYSWELTESGDFIDFFPSPIVFTDSFSDEGSTFGYFASAGLDIPLSPTWLIYFQGRWQWASQNLNGDFEGFGTLDLSGYDVSAGFSWTF